jgi:hypothetical protein
MTLDGDCLELLGIDLDVCAFADFVAFDNLLGIHFVAGLCIDVAVLDPVSGVLIDLMKANFLAF